MSTGLPWEGFVGPSDLHSSFGLCNRAGGRSQAQFHAGCPRPQPLATARTGTCSQHGTGSNREEPSGPQLCHLLAV